MENGELPVGREAKGKCGMEIKKMNNRQLIIEFKSSVGAQYW
jgi:hypothetical protein